MNPKPEAPATWHRWNIETTGTACGDHNAMNITNDLSKVNCLLCQPAASLPPRSDECKICHQPLQEGNRHSKVPDTCIVCVHRAINLSLGCSQREESARTAFDVEPYGESETLVYACNILDLAKQDWKEVWSEHDEKVRAGLSAMITRRVLPAPSPAARGVEDLLIEDAKLIFILPLNGVEYTHYLGSPYAGDEINRRIRASYLRDREQWVSVLQEARLFVAARLADTSSGTPIGLESCNRISGLLHKIDALLPAPPKGEL